VKIFTSLPPLSGFKEIVSATSPRLRFSIAEAGVIRSLPCLVQPWAKVKAFQQQSNELPSAKRDVFGPNRSDSDEVTDQTSMSLCTLRRHPKAGRGAFA
jgi:hypothetical protein